MAVSLSSAFSEILSFVFEWDDLTGYRVEVSLNTDYYNEDVSPEQLQAMLKAVQTGGISFDSYYWQLEQKEFWPPNWSKDKELEKIQETLSPFFDLSEERFLAVSSRIDKLEQITGENSTAATAAFIAPLVADDAQPVDENGDVIDDSVVVEENLGNSEENVENN